MSYFRKGDYVGIKKDEIILRGLKANNLKNLDLNIKKEQITVFTGLSGSGKSSVVFDTLATESRRQMTLNYPLYVRNQMPRYERPQADLMQNLSPVVVVEQKPIGGNSRSTLGTYMDIDPLIRLLFSRIGTPPVESATDFSTQSSFGRCPKCSGFGKVVSPDVNKLIDFDKSLKPEGEKVYAPFHTKNGPQPHEWDGLLPRFTRLYINRDVSKLKQVTQDDVLAMSSHRDCPTCNGSGLNPQVLACKINDLNIAQYNQLELTELLKELTKITDPLGKSIATQALPLVKQLIDLGLNYLSLSRKMGTLSGGEAQRVKIARHLGSSLNNLTYIFDEPSAGLHPEEVNLLINMLQTIKNQYNTVIVIEHDLSVIKEADEIIEMGPGAGISGGEVIYQGKLDDLKKTPTAASLQHQLMINQSPRQSQASFNITHANHNNLKNISLNIPKNSLVSVCGVSGSGKSSLMLEAFPEKYPDVIMVSQARIGISSRSTLATYMGIMDDIRDVFAKETNQPAGLFSFNSLGACPVCKGKGNNFLVDLKF